MNWTAYALVALGGALGAMTRAFVGAWVQTRLPHSTFPWGTFVINVTGCFILGLVGTLLAERVLTHPNIRPLVTVGFVGAYTTFSTFEYESLQLGLTWQALGNLVGSVAVGYGCVWLGTSVALWISAHAHRVVTHV